MLKCKQRLWSVTCSKCTPKQPKVIQPWNLINTNCAEGGLIWPFSLQTPTLVDPAPHRFPQKSERSQREKNCTAVAKETRPNPRWVWDEERDMATLRWAVRSYLEHWAVQTAGNRTISPLAQVGRKNIAHLVTMTLWVQIWLQASCKCHPSLSLSLLKLFDFKMVKRLKSK